MKKLLSLLLALLMVGSALWLAACSGYTEQTGNTPAQDAPAEEENDTPSADQPADVTEDETEAETEAERIALELPARDYTGESFHILEWSANGNNTAGDAWIVWAEADATDEAGDLMSNAVFARNNVVEEKYGLTITAEYAAESPQQFIQLMTLDNQTSSNAYQLSTMRSLNVWPMIESGLYLDMNEFAGSILHTDKPWWPDDAVESYALGDALYVCATEMLLRDKGATATIYFNTALADDAGLTNFYELVELGEWTLENMISACSIVARDNDGDDLINSGKDVWGIVNGDDPIFYLYAAADRKFGHMDESGYLVYDFGEKENILLTEEIFDSVMYADWYYNTYVNSGNVNFPDGGAFKNDLSLFYLHMVKNSYLDLRDMETDYGILPMPKYDSEQDDYASLVWVHHDCTVGIPSAVFDPEMSAIVLEALSYEGYYTVTPVLYETLLLNRMAKTEEAKRSLEIVFDTRVYDPGQYWVGDQTFTSKLLRHTATGTSGIASLWAEHESALGVQLDKVNEFIDATR